ncbi:MAG: chemotaxis protein CheD [Proteobacteria bacterium]|nr:chemotaxis protein CheD [Desulfobulbaceae bacterium]MBU4151766.1 chemotaxis protein CheD [Pseudomonadota bacterium]
MSTGSLSLAARFLKPGEIAFLSKPTIVTTILGSCVAIILYDPQSCLGAICHAVFPQSAGEQDLKYVDQALSRMLVYFDRRAIKHSQIVTKLFGGADMFCKGNHGVGNKNVDAALRRIEEAGLCLTASDVGGGQGRKLLFKSYTGEVFLKKFHAKDSCL